MISEQGVVLDRVERCVPVSTPPTATEVFDPGRHHLVWSQSSAVQVRTPRFEMLVASPQGLWIPAGHPYEVEASSPWWTGRFVADSCSPSWQRIAHLGLDDVVAPILTHLAHHPSSDWSSPLLSAVVAHLLDAFVAGIGPLRFPIDPRAREVADGLVADPSTVMELADWAPRVGASERTLRRLFAEQTGMSFRAWRSRLRVHAAMRLLGDAVPVGEVARRCGYRSRGALDKTFIAHTGVTPAQYARRGDADPSSRVAWPSSSRTWPPGSNSSSKPLVELLHDLTGDEMTGWSRKLGLLGAAMGLIAAACGSDDDATETTPTVPAEGSEAPGTSASLPTEASAMSDGSTATEVTDTTAAAYPRTIEHALGTTVIDERPELVVFTGARAAVGDMLALGVDVDFLARGWDDASFPAAQAYYDAADGLGITAADGPEFFVEFNVEDFITLGADVLILPDNEPEFLPDFERLRELVPTVVLPTGSRAEFQAVLADVFAVDPARLDAARSSESEALNGLEFPADLQVSLIAAYDYGAFEVEVFNDTSTPGRLLEEQAGVDLKEQEPVDDNWAYLSEETVELLDTDVIVNMVTYGPPQVLDDSPVFQAIPAVEDGRFVQLSYDESFAINFPSLLTAPLVADALEKVLAVAPE